MPWAELLSAALKLGIAPGAFWRLSLAEWNAMLSVHGQHAAAPLSRQGFEELQQRFPDHPDTENKL